MVFKTNKNNQEYGFEMKITHHQDKDYYTILCFDDAGICAGRASFKISKMGYRPSIWIYKIETFENFQNRGLGKAILDTVEMFAKLKRIYIIEGKFYPDNEYAEPFYIKNGYGIDRDYSSCEIYKHLVFDKVSCPFEQLEIVEEEIEQELV